MSPRFASHRGAPGLATVPTRAAAGQGLRTRGLFAALAFVLSLGGPGDRLHADPAGAAAPLRFGFSSQIFRGVNETDARAALKIWARTLAANRTIAVNDDFAILKGTDAIRTALSGGKVDAVSMTVVEFWELHRAVRFAPTILLPFAHGASTEEYLLLVRHDNPATALADLRSHSVAIYEGPRASLGAIWAETELLEADLGRAEAFWSQISNSSKFSQVILRVFFRQTDACVTTREGFRLMTELNPQVGQQLRILAHSRPLVSAPMCFREDLHSPVYSTFIAEIEQVVQTPAGRQTLALFQSEQVVARPLSELDAECALLDRHQRLLAEALLRQPAAIPAATKTGDIGGTP